MISGALTAFLTGITEPIEFAFLFVAPMLYAVHSVLAGLAYFLCVALDIKHGFTFSHGLIDYIVLFPKSSGALWLFVIGPIWGGDLLCHLLLRGPPVPSAHAGPRGGRGGQGHARGVRRPVRAPARSRLRGTVEHRQPRCMHHAAA